MTAVSLTSRLAEGALLRLALKLDAVVTGANGLVYLVAANPLEDVLGLEPAALTRGIGGFLVAFAAAVWLVATRREIHRAAVTAVIEANVLWALGSIGFVVAGVSSPTTAGSVWIVLQALVVAGFAGLQAYARRGS